MCHKSNSGCRPDVGTLASGGWTLAQRTDMAGEGGGGNCPGGFVQGASVLQSNDVAMTSMLTSLTANQR